MSTPRARAGVGWRLFGSKLKLVHVAKRAVGLTDEEYRAILLRVAGVKGSSELTPEGFDSVMAEFKRLGFTSTGTQRKPKGAGGTAPNHPTPSQWRLLEDRARKVGYDDLEDPRFITWVKPRGNVEHPRFLDQAGLQRVLAALGNWINRKTDR